MSRERIKRKQGQLSYRRGVCVQWLVHWTNTNDAWELNGIQVREIVRKETSQAKKCCYVDMPKYRSQRDAGKVNQAHISLTLLSLFSLLRH